MEGRTVQASEAKTHLPGLLDEVERGTTLIITRHGKRIARIVPEQDARKAEILQAIAELREFRKGRSKITVEELLSARDEGRRI